MPPASAILVDFQTVKVNDRLFVLGRGQEGVVTVVESSRYGKVRSVTVEFANGKRVTYTAKTFAACRGGRQPPPIVAPPPIIEDVAPPPEGIPAKDEPEVVVQKAPVIRKVSPTVRPTRLPRAVPAVKQETRQFEIPGPPVPKPKRGVWSD